MGITDAMWTTTGSQNKHHFKMMCILSVSIYRNRSWTAMKDALYSAKRVLLGSVLIAMASFILLISDHSSHAVKNKTILFHFIGYSDSAINDDCLRGVLDGLTEAGYQRDRDYRIVINNAQGDMGTLNNILDMAAQQKPSLIFTSSTPTLQAAIKKITDLPVVFTNSADPIAAGAGTSFTSHQTNVTGISTMSDFDGMMDLLAKMLPGIHTIGTLFVPGEINSTIYRDRLEEAARRRHITLVSVPVTNSSEISNATVCLIGKGIDALCQIADNLTSSSMAGIAQQARENGIPLFVFQSSEINEGAVAAVARDYHQAGKDAVAMALNILKGEDPEHIPFCFVSRTRVIINMEASRFYGIQVSESLLRQADEVIGR